jgi:hypothetical protein
MAAGLFRFIGGAARNMIVANVFASFMLLVVMVLGGFILVRGKCSYFSLIVILFNEASLHKPMLLYILSCRKNKEMVDLGLLDLPNDVCTECHFSE